MACIWMNSRCFLRTGVSGEAIHRLGISCSLGGFSEPSGITRRGLDLLVPAFARLAQKDTMLVIAGPDNDGYGDKVRQMVAENKLEDRVIFAGMLYGADRVAALADADLFCLPSYQENFGIAVVEALAAGTPAIISDQVNLFADVLEAEVGGAVPCKVEPLVAELDRWLGDGELKILRGGRGEAVCVGAV